MVALNYSDLNILSASSTRKLGSINTDLLQLDLNQEPRILEGPCIMLYLPDGLEPVQLHNIAVVTLGRSDKNKKTQPMLDLNANHAKLLGVSRIHAEIFYRDGNYFVRDLESTNGTWVNNHKLENHEEIQLSDGDSLRLANLMIQIGGC